MLGIKRLVVVATVFLALTDAASAAQRRTSRIARSGSPTNQKYGIGLILGEPTGITGKMWLSPITAIDGGIAYSFNSFFLFYSDYLYHFPRAFGHETQFVSELTPYIGVGGMFLIESSTNNVDRSYFHSNQGSVGLAIRVPLGIEWRPADGAPLGVFVELAPGIGIIPTTYGVIQGGIGARYYF
jgi:hypothetical protein